MLHHMQQAGRALIKLPYSLFRKGKQPLVTMNIVN